ncbi:hypothetical protein Bbelb_024210 [Branchiostoma belcheri]|nr:hypothetical protein Bbelb_024210 [Branchiostoma belcheri]
MMTSGWRFRRKSSSSSSSSLDVECSQVYILDYPSQPLPSNRCRCYLFEHLLNTACARGDHVRKGFGEVEGKTVSELRALVEKSGQSPEHFCPPGGESPLQVKARAEAFFHDLCNDLAAEFGIGQVETLQHAAMADGTAERDCGMEGNVLGEWNIDERDSKTSGTLASDSDSASNDKTGVTVASNLQTQNAEVSLASNSQTEDSEKYNAQVLLVSHGGTIRELFRHLIDDLGCKVKSKRFAMKISPNCGISQFVVQLREGGKRPVVSCHFLHDKSHLEKAVDFDL